MSQLKQDSHGETSTEERQNTPVTIGTVDSRLKIMLAGPLGVANIRELHESLLPHLNEEFSTVEVDPSAVTSVDSTALQLLNQLIAHTKSQGCDFRWVANNEQLEKVAGILALTDALELAA